MTKTTNAYEHLNAQEVLNQVELLLEKVDRWGYRIRSVYPKLSIFDWWNDTLSKSQLQDMRVFLRRAIKEGFTGYVCFKVGAKGCASGMWAHTVPTTNGYSPNEGDVLYRSFQSEGNYWQVRTQDTDFSEPVDTGNEVAKLYKQLKAKKCILCDEEYEGWGNNAWPLADGECCDECNERVVDARFERMCGIG